MAYILSAMNIYMYTHTYTRMYTETAKLGVESQFYIANGKTKNEHRVKKRDFERQLCPENHIVHGTTK